MHRLIASLLAVVHSVAALRCGQALTKECLGATDIRYNKDASNAAKDQAAVWVKMDGFFRGVGRLRVNGADPSAGIPADPADGNPVSVRVVDYLNATIEGSRQYYHTYLMNTVIRPAVQERFAYFTTSHEKDGSLLALPDFFAGNRNLTNRTASDSSLFATVNTSFLTRSYAVNDNSIYISTPATNEFDGLNSATRVCLDDQCNLLHEAVDGFYWNNGTMLRNMASEIFYTRINSAQEWRAMLLQEYDAFNFTESERIVPVDDPCELNMCPKEEEWCLYDPNCSPSPYQEPEGSLKPSVIAAIDVVTALLVFGVLWALHRWLVRRQARKTRSLFATRIAETIKLETSSEALSPEDLVEEFKRIDGGAKDGKLSKDELWEFISSGKAGAISQNDFNALFSAIDLDKSGYVDFLEFCAFMGKCEEEINLARKRSLRSSENRLQAAEDNIARRLSVLTSSASLMKTLEEGDEGDVDIMPGVAEER